MMENTNAWSSISYHFSTVLVKVEKRLQTERMKQPLFENLSRQGSTYLEMFIGVVLEEVHSTLNFAEPSDVRV